MKIILAGGCFWGMEELLRSLPGVQSTRVGYTGGHLLNPTYDDTHDSKSGHAEAIEITYNPEEITYRKILEYFFQIHDPTTLNRQGNDRGTQYRSAIFYSNEEQKVIAQNVIDEINASGKWPSKVATQLEPESIFYLAEDHHQNYLQKNPYGYTCHWERSSWTLKS
ncbi:MAG: peptide-methionine (S)-S-oxide reductase MsrA [Pseudomonadota bacterium]